MRCQTHHTVQALSVSIQPPVSAALPLPSRLIPGVPSDAATTAYFHNVILGLHEDISLPISPLYEVFPLPKPLPPPPQREPGQSLQPADLLDLLPPLHPIGPDDPFHPDDVPSIELPGPSFSSVKRAWTPRALGLSRIEGGRNTGESL
ncbi:hypothetical protein B0H13DRAFT_2305386 [Mycena leptocephala]|nr:hypothetical protein B0H13DRAFT_2305386 [Mycena leptocephala]